MRTQVRKRLVAILLIALLITPFLSGNFIFTKQDLYAESTEQTTSSQEQVTINDTSPSTVLEETTNESSETVAESQKDVDVTLGPETDPSVSETDWAQAPTESELVKEVIIIGLDTRGGYPLEPLIVDKGAWILELPIPFKDDEVFLAWATEIGEPINLPFEAVENTVLYAVWKEKITISFDTRGGDPIDPLIVDIGSIILELPIPFKGGERFLGWAIETGDPIQLPLEAAANMILYAVWDEQAFIPENPDHLTVFDESPYGGAINYSAFPESPLPLLGALLSSRITANNPPIIGTDHPTSVGEVMLFKEAKPVIGKVNTWDIKLRVEGKNKITTSDIILVIDTSGSMGDSGRMAAAITAAKAFIDSLLPSQTTRIGIVTFQSDATLARNFTNDSTSLKSAVNGLTANGGTFTQAAVKQAETMLANSNAVNKHIVLLSDGVPTYSYKLSNPDAYLIAYGSGSDKQTSTAAPSSAYLSDRIGAGNDMYWQYSTSGTRKFYNHGNSAIAQAGFARATGYRVWTIALQVDATGQSVLSGMASPNSYYTADPASLSTIFTAIAGQIGSAVKDATVIDPMGIGFEVPAGKVASITASQGSKTYANNKITWNTGTLTQPISPGSDIYFAELTYTIEITDDILSQTPDSSGLYPTNGNAQISYTDADAHSQTASFPIPMVNPVLYKIIKVLQDKDGNEITANRNFTIQVIHPATGGGNPTHDHVLNTSSQNSTKTLTDLRNVGVYTFVELFEPSDYDVRYYVDGQETTNRMFTITDGNTPDVTLKVVNKEKTGSLTITKFLDQSLVQTPVLPTYSLARSSLSFEFTVAGPGGYVESFSLPNNGSWTMQLIGLATGTYSITETTSGYTTTMQVNDGPQVPGNTVDVNIAIGNLSQTVKVTNKPTENMTVTASKIWENGPTTKPNTWFQLIRVNADDTETTIGSPRLVEGTSVTWNQADQGLADLLIGYDENGTAYEYKVKEVNAQGNDFVPENYTKVENGLTVTNTYIKKVSVQVTKGWEDGNNQDGVRPESVTLKLYANGNDTNKTLILTATSNWTGTFSDLDENADGNPISYTVEEVALDNGYETSITGTAADGYTVTNRKTPATLTVSGAKTWADNNNQDGKRPVSITVRLLKNGMEISSKIVTEQDGWAWSFTNLAKFEVGTLITYTVTEDTVAEYSSQVSGYNVTNTHTPGKTSVQVTKAWDDSNNQDGVRPEAVTIKLLADGEPTNETLILTATNNWTGTFSDLDQFANGNPISYTVAEDALGNGYDTLITGTAAIGYTVTNSRTPETLTVSGAKTWADNNNQDGMRPEIITVRLLKNGLEIDQKSLTEQDDWTWSFINLAKYENGALITYTVTEDAVAEYSSQVFGHNVTNTHTPGKTSIQVTKAWADRNNQDGVRPGAVIIKLLANGFETDKTLILTATNNWTGTFSELDEYADGTPISYTVEEVALGNGYETSITGTAAEGYTVTNGRTPETLTVSGVKTWTDNNNQDGMRPDNITVRLLKNGTEIEQKIVTVQDGWAWSFTDLAKFHEGELITYTVTEDTVDEYSSYISGYNVTNTHTPGKTSVQVTKAWADNNDQDGVRPESVTIKLFADGEPTNETLILTAINNWTGTFSDLDEFAEGQLISYTVEEVVLGSGYQTSITGTAASGYTVTNSRTPETLTVSGAKIWTDNNNQDGKRPESITIHLLKNGTEIDQKIGTEQNGWAWSFANLAKFEDGTLITYTITEDAVPEYSTGVSGYNVTNTHTPGKTSVQVSKAWADTNNQDGIRPEAVTIKLLADGIETDKALVLTATNNWTGTFSNLDEYVDGTPISYTVEEVAPGNGYETSITGTATNGYTVTNSRTPETLSVNGAKTWADNNNQDGMRPQSITINLLKNGNPFDQKTVTEQDGWAWSFANLAKFEHGTLITYTVTEDVVPEYSMEVSGYNATNTHTPGKTSVQVTKAWADRNNQDGIRPEAITLKLLADGIETDKTLVLTETNNWTGTFNNLDEYVDGTLISYTVEEVALGNGYETSVTGTAANGFIVTNIRTPETILVDGSKTWADNSNQDGQRPDSITIRLLKNGVEISQKTVTEQDGWAWSFADLAKFENGTLIPYTVTEDAVTEYSSEVSGYNVTNTHTPGQISIQVTKAWADKNNQDRVRPEEVTIKLLANEVETDKTLTLIANNNWTGTFTNLDEYANGELVKYTIEEVAIGNGYETSITGTASDGYIVTNSRTPETFTLSGSATWVDADDQDGKRPDNITIHLLKNGLEFGHQKNVNLTDDGWAWTFADLDKFEDGELITYTLTEDDIAEYGIEIFGYDVTNTHIPGITSVKVTKAWADGNNQDGIRPGSVTIKLLIDGVANEEFLILSAANNWTDTFTGLDEYAKGKILAYTVEEFENTNGYEYSATGTAVDGYTVTNTHQPAKTSVKVTKVWADGNNKDGVRPMSVTIKLLANGKATDKTLVLTANNNWTGAFIDLAEYADGKLISYTVEEIAIGKGYMAVVSGDQKIGYKVTNNRTPNQPTQPTSPEKPTYPTTPQKPSYPTAPTAPIPTAKVIDGKMTAELPSTGESDTMYAWISALFLSLGIALIALKRDSRLKNKNE